MAISKETWGLRSKRRVEGEEADHARSLALRHTLLILLATIEATEQPDGQANPDSGCPMVAAPTRGWKTHKALKDRSRGNGVLAAPRPGLERRRTHSP